MSEQATIQRARKDKRAGKSPSTQAGEFVREEFHHIRAGKHGARSPQQAIAIGLSKARRAGVKLPPPSRGQSLKVRRQAERDYEKGQYGNRRVSPRRSRATELLRNVPPPRKKRRGRECLAEKIYDSQTQIRRISPLFAQDKSCHRQAPQSRHIWFNGCGATSRKAGSILQTTLMLARNDKIAGLLPSHTAAMRFRK